MTNFYTYPELTPRKPVREGLPLAAPVLTPPSRHPDLEGHRPSLDLEVLEAAELPAMATGRACVAVRALGGPKPQSGDYPAFTAAPDVPSSQARFKLPFRMCFHAASTQPTAARSTYSPITQIEEDPANLRLESETFSNIVERNLGSQRSLRLSHSATRGHSSI